MVLPPFSAAKTVCVEHLAVVDRQHAPVLVELYQELRTQAGVDHRLLLPLAAANHAVRVDDVPQLPREVVVDGHVVVVARVDPFQVVRGGESRELGRDRTGERIVGCCFCIVRFVLCRFFHVVRFVVSDGTTQTSKRTNG